MIVCVWVSGCTGRWVGGCVSGCVCGWVRWADGGKPRRPREAKRGCMACMSVCWKGLVFLLLFLSLSLPRFVSRIVVGISSVRVVRYSVLALPRLLTYECALGGRMFPFVLNFAS